MRYVVVKIALVLLSYTGSSVEGKFNGIAAGASIGGNVASLKGGNISDTLKQWGGNAKLYLGIGKTFADFVFVGVEAFGEYNFLSQKDSNKSNLENGAQIGGYLRAGLCPSENILLYGLYGVQTNTAKVKGLAHNITSESQSGWSSIFGIGLEYSLALGAVIRVEGTYVPEQKFEMKELPDMKFESEFISVNVGVIVYL